MSQIKVNGQYLDIDVRAELEEFEWHRPVWRDNKLQAASPFRYDRTPSFYVDLTSGGWKDAGAYDADWEHGNLPKLLAFLRNETYEEACERLIEVYGTTYDAESDKFTINLPVVAVRKTKKVLEENELIGYNYRHEYLGKRCITEKVQRFAGVGYSKGDKAITIPWRHADGALANIKYRKVYGKTFWYKRGGAPIRTLVYGIDKVYKHNLTEVVVCEAEIDALSWYTCSKPAIALGGTAITDEQLEIIRKSPIQTLIIAPDNDKPGQKLFNRLSETLQGYVHIKSAKIPAQYKDANEALVNGFNLSGIPTKYIGIKTPKIK